MKVKMKIWLILIIFRKKKRTGSPRSLKIILNRLLTIRSMPILSKKESLMLIKVPGRILLSIFLIWGTDFFLKLSFWGSKWLLISLGLELIPIWSIWNKKFRWLILWLMCLMKILSILTIWLKAALISNKRISVHFLDVFYYFGVLWKLMENKL